MKVDLRSCDKKQFNQFVEDLGEKPFRSKQLYEWVHQKMVKDFDEMTNLPKAFREKCRERFFLGGIVMEKKQVSAQDETEKYLFSCSDGNVIESVQMKYKHGNSVCISSQVGCKMGCTFCASTLGGFVRNLTAGEMLSQVYEIQRENNASFGGIRERVSHVVIMGMGEPLDNYDNVLKFIRLISDEHGLHISQRNITVSTCGLVDQVKRLEKERFQITLAISLHAPNDEIRKKIMPIAKRYPMEELINTCREYTEKTGRRVTFEYSMIHGVNDKEEYAKELAKRLYGLNCHVNCIPLNEVKEWKCIRSTEKNINVFKKTLEKYRINVTIRRGMGSDIDAACGQLRKKFLDREGR